MRWKTARKLFPTSRRDTLICIGILSLAMLLCSLLRILSEGDVYAALIFETAVIFVSRYTNGYLLGKTCQDHLIAACAVVQAAFDAADGRGADAGLPNRAHRRGTSPRYCAMASRWQR